MAQGKDFYNLLGVSKDASQEIISAAFEKLSTENQPVLLSRCPIACALSNIAPHMP